MENPIWVPRVVVLATHHEQLVEHGGLQGVRDPNGLEAALARPEQRNHYDPSGDAADLAAAYLFGIVRGHPFADANKRVGLATALVFLELNGYDLVPEVDDEAVATAVLAVADGSMDEAGLAAWLRERLVPTRS